MVCSLEKGALGLVSKAETVDSSRREVYVVSVVSPLVVSTCAPAVWSLGEDLLAFVVEPDTCSDKVSGEVVLVNSASIVDGDA